jgi:hypothetical protein
MFVLNFSYDRNFKVTKFLSSFFRPSQLNADDKGEHYYTYGALLYAKPIEAREIPGKIYVLHFTDYTYQPLSTDRFTYQEGEEVTFSDGKVVTKLINQTTQKSEQVELIPIGKTILRQVTF